MSPTTIMRSALGTRTVGRSLAGLVGSALLAGSLVLGVGSAQAQSPGTISGQVTASATGSALQGILVTVHRQTDSGFQSVASTTTNHEGRYTVSGLDTSRDHLVDFTDPADQTSAQACENDPFAGERRLVSAGQLAGGAVVDVALARGAMIFGRVVANHTGEGVGGISVTAVAENVVGPSVPAPTTTDAGGRYWICELPRDRYQVHFDPHPSTGLARERIGSVDLEPRDRVIRDVALLRNGSMSGRVTETPSGASIPGATITLLPSHPLFGPRSTQAGSDGSYRFGNVRPDTYRVRFEGINHNHVTEFYNDREIFQHADPVRVRDNQAVGGIDAAIAFGARVSGTIRSGDGTPLNCEVFLFRTGNRDARELVLPFAHPRRVFSSGGSYQIGPVAPGRYVLGAANCAGGGFGQRYRASASEPLRANEIVVPSGDSQSGVDLVLPPAGFVTGRAAIGGHTGVGGICVWAHHVDSRGTRLVSHTQTGSDGHYVLSLAEGLYAIEFEDCSRDRFATVFYHNSPDVAGADLVTVRTGEQTPHVDGILRATSGDPGTGSTAPPAGSTQPVSGPGTPTMPAPGTQVLGAQSRQTTATLDRTVVHPGDRITAAASGYATGTATVATVHPEPPVEVGRPRADSVGNVLFTFTVTSDIGLGAKRLEIVGQAPDGVRLVAVGNFQVVPVETPTPTPSPAPAADLPRTGVDALVYGVVGTWGIFMGLMLLHAARRRREQHDLQGYI